MAAPETGDGGRRTWPCAACTTSDKICLPDCVFAPLFPPDRTTQFMMVYKVFGEMNPRKLLSKLPLEHRKDAADSLVYEAEARLRDPLRGCIGTISFLQRKLKGLQEELATAEADLARYMVMMPGTSKSATDDCSSALDADAHGNGGDGGKGNAGKDQI